MFTTISSLIPGSFDLVSSPVKSAVLTFNACMGSRRLSHLTAIETPESPKYSSALTFINRWLLSTNAKDIGT